MRSEIEKLERELAELPEDAPERVDKLFTLVVEYWAVDSEKSRQLQQEAGKLAQNINYLKGIYVSKLYKALTIWTTQSAVAAVPVVSEIIEWFEYNNHPKELARSKSFLGMMYWSFGDYQKGFSLCTEAYEILEKEKDLSQLAWISTNLAGFHYDLKDFKKSMQYFERSYKFFKQSEDISGQARTLNGIGNNLHHLGKLAEALEYQNKSLDLCAQIDNKLIESRTLNDVGSILKTQGKFEESLQNHLKSLEYRREFQYSIGESTTLIDLGEVYLSMKKYTEAIDSLNQAIEVSKNLNAKPKITRALEVLSRVYIANDSLEKAIDTLQILRKEEEEFFREDKDQKINQIKETYAAQEAKKEAEIYRLKNVELKEKNEEYEKTLNYLNGAQAQLVQSEKMAAIGKLAAGVAHEINSPLGTLKSNNDTLHRSVTKMEAVNLANEDVFKPEGGMEKWASLLNINYQTNVIAIDKVHGLMSNLKRFVHLDEAKLQEVNLPEEIETCLSILDHMIPQKLILEKNFSYKGNLLAFPQDLNQAIVNILNNAFQAMPNGGLLMINTLRKDDLILIEINDSGKGIPEQNLQKLFDPDFTVDQNRVKMRSGLFVTYQIMDKHKGNIDITSEIGKGTSVTLTFPKKN